MVHGLKEDGACETAGWMLAQGHLLCVFSVNSPGSAGKDAGLTPT